MRTSRRFLIGLLLALTLMLAISHPIRSVQALRDRKALLPTADSYVTREFPDANLGREWILRVMGDGTLETLAFLMFDLGEIPSNAVVEEAELRLYAPGGSSNGIVYLHYCGDNDWTEFGVTYNNKPAYSPELLGTINVTSQWTWYEVNLTETARSTFSKGDKRLSLAITGETLPHAVIVEFDSRTFPLVPSGENTHPQLSVLYSYTPSSGIDPVLVGLIAIGIVGISSVGLGLVYIWRKRRKQS